MVPDALLPEVPEMMDTPPILCSYRKPRTGLLFFIDKTVIIDGLYFYISLQSVIFCAIIISKNILEV